MQLTATQIRCTYLNIITESLPGKRMHLIKLHQHVVATKRTEVCIIVLRVDDNYSFPPPLIFSWHKKVDFKVTSVHFVEPTMLSIESFASMKSFKESHSKNLRIKCSSISKCKCKSFSANKSRYERDNRGRNLMYGIRVISGKLSSMANEKWKCKRQPLDSIGCWRQ